jgi:hypothetical protein
VVKALFLVCALLLIAPLAQAQEIERIEVLEYGLYQRGDVVGELPPSPNGIGRSQVNGIKHLRTTRRVPARLGTSFGFRFRVHGKPIGEVGDLVQVLILPPEGLKSEISGKTVTRDAFSTQHVIGGEDFMTMSFDYRWELVPGIWTVQLWSGRRKLAEQSFEVYVPPSV